MIPLCKIWHQTAVADDPPIIQPLAAEDIAETFNAVVDVRHRLRSHAASKADRLPVGGAHYPRHTLLRIFQDHRVVARERVPRRNEQPPLVKTSVRHALDQHVRVGAVVEVLVREQYKISLVGGQLRPRGADMREASGAWIYDPLNPAIAEPEAARAAHLAYHRETSAACAKVLYKVLRIGKILDFCQYMRLTIYICLRRV